MRPDQLPERPLDPDWPGDADPQEEMESRQKLLAALTRDEIREMINDSLDDHFIDTVKRLVIEQGTQTASEHVTVGAAFNDRVAAEREKYLDEHE